MKKCSYCGRENSAAAPRCQECGTVFDPDAGPAATAETQVPENPRDVTARKQMLWGAFACSCGVLVTFVSYINAVSGPFGGTYIIAWGAILFGAVRFVQGWKSRGIESGRDDLGYEALAEATRLEVAGRVEEALAIYHKVVTEFPASDAGRDAQKSIESLQAKLGR